MAAVDDTQQICPDIDVALAVVVLYAGGVSTAIIDPKQIDRGAWQDVRKIMAMLDECGQGSNKPLDLSLAEGCYNYLVEYWRHVDALAEALLKDGRIVKSKDIRAILGPRPIPVRKIVKQIASIWNDRAADSVPVA